MRLWAGSGWVSGFRRRRAARRGGAKGAAAGVARAAVEPLEQRRLLSVIVNQPPTIQSLQVSAAEAEQGEMLTLVAQGLTDADGYVSGVEFYHDSNNNRRLDASSDMRVGFCGALAKNWRAKVSKRNLPGGINRFFVQARDDRGALSRVATVVVSVHAPRKPTVGSLVASPAVLAQGRPVTLSAMDVGDGEAAVSVVRFYYDLNDNGELDRGYDPVILKDRKGGNGWGFTRSTRSLSPGGHRFFAQAEAADRQRSDPAAVVVTVNPNEPPVIESFSASPDPVSRGEMVMLTAKATDADALIAGARFVRDTNGNRFLDEQDAVLWDDLTPADGLTWGGSSADWPLGSNYFFVVVVDDGGAFNYATLNVMVADLVAPRAKLDEISEVRRGSQPVWFTVVYNDNTPIRMSNLGRDEILVTSESGYSATARLVGRRAWQNRRKIVATYEIDAPGGVWDGEDDGVYTIQLASGRLADGFGNFAGGKRLGTFKVELTPQGGWSGGGFGRQ